MTKHNFALLDLCYTLLFQYRIRRSIDLSATNPLIPDNRLPTDLVPVNYTLRLELDADQLAFHGTVNITMTCTKQTNQINLHAHHDLQVDEENIELVHHTDNGKANTLKIRRVDRVPKKPLLVIYLHDDLTVGGLYEVRINFKGMIWENTEGLFQGKYKIYDGDQQQDRSYFASYFRPHNARRVFPCFDEPAYKVPFQVTIVRPKGYHTLFNTDIASSETISNDKVADHFKITPPISTFALGFVVSDLLEDTDDKVNKITMPIVKVWARKEFHEQNKDVKFKVQIVLEYLINYWNVSFPLDKIDIVALPNFSAVKPADNLGLVVFR